MRLSYRQSVAGGANTERIQGVSSTDTVWLYGLFTARSGARVCFFETTWAYVWHMSKAHVYCARARGIRDTIR